VAGFGNTVFEILYASAANGVNVKKPSPTARPNLQVAMEAPTQHI